VAIGHRVINPMKVERQGWGGGYLGCRIKLFEIRILLVERDSGCVWADLVCSGALLFLALGNWGWGQWGHSFGAKGSKRFATDTVQGSKSAWGLINGEI
jgi:hypothetical protein